MTASSSTKAPALNPFIFPSDTTFRFILLISAILGASIYIFNTLFYTVWIPAFPKVQIEAMQCVQSLSLSDVGMLDDLSSIMQNGPSDIIASGQTLTKDWAVNLEALKRCDRPIDTHFMIWELAGLFLLLLVAAVIYWFWPQWKIKRESLKPIDLSVSPELESYLKALCQTARLRKQPTFLTKSLNGTLSGLAFGRNNQYYVVLPGGLITYFHKDRAVFRAVVLHELAHIRNRDVTKTYFTLAIWWAFVWVAVVPFVCVNIWKPSQLLGFGALSVAAFTMLVYFIRNSILRSRELYADARASAWDENNTTLQTFFRQQPSVPKKKRNLLGELHPSPMLRATALDNPNQLFSINFNNLLFAGIVTGLIIPSISYFFAAASNIAQFSYLPTDGVYNRIILVSLEIIAFIPLLACALGISTWRAALAQQITGQPYLKQAKYLSIPLCIGLLIGRLIAFDVYLGFNGSDSLSTVLGYDSSEPKLTMLSSLAQRLPFEILWGLAFVFITFLFCQWLVMGSQIWIEGISSQKELNRAYRWNLLIVSGLLTMLIAWLLASRLFLEDTLFSLGMSLASAVLQVMQNPVATLAVAIFCTYPLATKLISAQGKPSHKKGWALLEPPTQAYTNPQRSFFSLKPVLKKALLGSLAFSLLIFTIRILMIVFLSDTTREMDSTRTILYFSILAIGVIAQMIVAATVLRQSKSFSIPQSLIATFITGIGVALCRILLSILLNPTTVNPSPIVDFFNFDLWMTTSYPLINLGFMFSVSMILVISVFSATKREAL